jgi:hypothetical protein
MKTIIFVLLFCSSLRAAVPVVTSTLNDQKKVAVTVYNSGIGVVRDERKIKLPVGESELKFMDIASGIKPETVRVESSTKESDFSILEQNYEYDLMSPEKLLEKYVGKKVTLIQYNSYKNERIPINAELLSYNYQKPIYKIDGEIVIYRK